ncbi:MAG: tRNA lysidine(34) synthetase TilS [Epsilonproteobacteria bacterium]|nr:tRNA lysidine(34) synthetase TilS [Campylobacterota bacterium]
MEQSSTNLLAFSGGVDSSALFFKLMDMGVEFDIISVNYKTRPQSDEEIQYAKTLAKKYNKKIYTKICRLQQFSEKKARDCRYKFFEEIIKKHGYKTLILAHQLNDRFEWFLMQLSKGAGVKELVSMHEFENRDFYTIWRPFYLTSRDEILNYLKHNDIKYFEDSSNTDTKYKRNYFRHKYSNPFLKEFKDGVKKSFLYLQEDKELLLNTNYTKIKYLYFFKKQNPKLDIKTADIILKKLSILPTKAQKDEILKTNFNCVIQGKIAIDSNEEFIFLAPYVKHTIPKEKKDLLRKHKIPPKIRPYIIKEKLCHTLFTEISTDA